MANVIKGSINIDRVRSAVLLSMLKLELRGMHRRGRSAYSIIKAEYGLKGSKQSVFDQFQALLIEADKAGEQ